MNTELSQQIEAKKARLATIRDERETLVADLEIQLEQTSSAMEQARIKGVTNHVKVSAEQIGEALAKIENADFTQADREMNRVTRLHQRGYVSDKDYQKAVKEHQNLQTSSLLSTRYAELPATKQYTEYY